MEKTLDDVVTEVYTDKASAFLERIKAMNLTDKELSAVPSLFLPGWGEDYESSFFKVAIAGKETLSWGTECGDSLKCDLLACEEGRYDVLSSCRRFREQGPSEWYNVFWQYPASALARLFNSSRDEILRKDNPLLRSIAWFNGHAIETYESKGVDKSGLTWEKMFAIQQAADECGLSDFGTFTRVFRPNLIFYFYRNKSGIPNRNFPSDIEKVQSWWNGMIDEYRLDGQTLLIQVPHTSYLTRGNLSQSALADIVYEILKTRGVGTSLCGEGDVLDFNRMSAIEWRAWVEFVRGEAQNHADMENVSLSRHLIAVVAKELAKRHATMNAQTLVLVLNEVDRFRRDNWKYSPERRGPCSSVRGAYNAYANDGKDVEADYIARAFTKLDGSYAYE